jgi:hypothetical protein
MELRMNKDTFNREIDKWIADVRTEAERLFDTHCAPETVLKIATQIADSRRIHEARATSTAIALPGLSPFPGPPRPS